MSFTARPDGTFKLGRTLTRCALGRSGVIAARDKREGDGATPAGVWPMRFVLYRPDRGGPPKTALDCRAVGPGDGWCDEPGDVAYNRQVALPYPSRCESLWREDRLYDRIVVLGYNDDPVVAGAGSAIFLHLAKDGCPPTEGCVAISPEDMEALLAAAAPGATVEITL